jgi:hypothetical protein
MQQNEKHEADGDAQLDKEVVPPSEANKPVFSVASLALTPVQTAEDIRKAIAEGRVAEMTPHQAGFDLD